MDFQKQNQGLLMKHIHKFFNKVDIPWVNLVWNYYPNGVPQVASLCGSFWWKDIMKLANTYLQLCKVKVGRGDTALFWSDNWNGQVFRDLFPRLFSFTLDAQLSVQEILHTADR